MRKLMLLTVLAITNCTMFAQKPGVVISDKTGWHKIGETMVDFKTESDEIMVLGADKFSSVKIKVDKAPINLESMNIYFRDGGTQSVSIIREFKEQGETKEVDLDGTDDRSIKKVTFVYRTVANYKDKKAQVELWGYKTNSDKKSSNTASK